MIIIFSLKYRHEIKASFRDYLVPFYYLKINFIYQRVPTSIIFIRACSFELKWGEVGRSGGKWFDLSPLMVFICPKVREMALLSHPSEVDFELNPFWYFFYYY